MKKMTLKMRLLGGLVAVSMLFVAGSCAQGADCDEVFSAGVTNAQLESPNPEDIQFNVGTGELSVSWPTMWGAGGYLCSVQEVTDPENPTETMEETTIDGTTFSFEVEDDKRYAVSIKTLGNERYNNTGAESATTVTYFVGVNGIEVPAGTEDLGAFINEQLAANAEAWDAERKADFNFEIAFDLAPGVEYQFATAVDFGLFPARIRSLFPDNPAFITYAAGGSITTQAGLRLQNLRIDASSADHQGLICLSTAPNEEILDTNLIYMGGTTLLGNKTYKELGSGKSAYIIEKPFELKNVWVKGLHCPFFNSYKDKVKQNYGITQMSIINSIIEIAAWNPKPNSNVYWLYLRQGNNQIMYLNMVESTIYSDGSYKKQFIGLNGQQATKVFGSVGTNGKWVIDHLTLYTPGNSSNFGDQMRNVPSSAVTNNIFYDTKKIFNNGNGFNPYSEVTNCTVYNPASSFDSSNMDADVKNGAAQPNDPGFPATAQSLDLHAENGGINFTPTGNALTDRRGDSRWLPAVE